VALELRLPVRLVVDGGPEATDTVALRSDPGVLTLRSSAAAAGAELVSTYTWHADLPQVLVSELAQGPGSEPELRARWIEAASTPLTHGHRILLYDHLAAVQDLAASGGRRASISGAGAAARALS
jgi:hypothetical protein